METNWQQKSNNLAKKTHEAELLVHKWKGKKLQNTVVSAREDCTNQEDLAFLSFDFVKKPSISKNTSSGLVLSSAVNAECFWNTNMEFGEGYFYIFHEGKVIQRP